VNRYQAVAVVASALLAVAACASDPVAARRSPEPAAPTGSDPLVTDTTARGRAAFGCALERGIVGADATTRHYAHQASHTLFVAALEDDHDYATAAYLWNASDSVQVGNDARALERLLDVCTAAGFEGAAGLPELRSYMCAMTGDLVRERPTVASFGPQSTRARPGDPRRNDVRFVGIAQFLLSYAETQRLDFGNPRLGLEDGDPSYGDGLHQVEAFCAPA
jgi:hypothetical protein